jgi:hypothetical protein
MRKYRLPGVFQWRIPVLIILSFFTASGLSAGDFSEKIKRPVEQTLDIRHQTQQAEDRWVAEKEKLSTKFEMLEKQHQQLRDQHAKLEKETAYHATKIRTLTKQIEDADRISTEIHPYLVSVVDQLKSGKDDGPPFLTAERSDRINRLQTVLADPEVDISEKYRKTMEAVMIEVEYGNTIEVYSDRIVVDDRNVQARIFRFGRVSLFFQSLDGKQGGFYHALERRWKYLPDKFNRDIGIAVAMGSKRRPVDLVNLPIGRVAVR